jgi:hypothetical protein
MRVVAGSMLRVELVRVEMAHSLVGEEPLMLTLSLRLPEGQPIFRRDLFLGRPVAALARQAQIDDLAHGSRIMACGSRLLAERIEADHLVAFRRLVVRGLLGNLELGIGRGLGFGFGAGLGLGLGDGFGIGS